MLEWRVLAAVDGLYQTGSLFLFGRNAASSVEYEESTVPWTMSISVAGTHSLRFDDCHDINSGFIHEETLSALMAFNRIGRAPNE